MKKENLEKDHYENENLQQLYKLLSKKNISRPDYFKDNLDEGAIQFERHLKFDTLTPLQAVLATCVYCMWIKGDPLENCPDGHCPLYSILCNRKPSN